MHDACHASVTYCRFEWQEELLSHFPWPEMSGSLVESTLGSPVTDHMLAGSDHAIAQVTSHRALKATHKRTSHGRCQEWVLTICLFDPAPSGISSQIQDRSKSLSQTQRPHATPNGMGDGFDQVRVPTRGSADGLLEAWRGPGHKAVQCLLVEDGWDSQTCFFYEEPLDGVPRSGHL